MLRLAPVLLVGAGCVVPLGMPPARTELGYGGRTGAGAASRFAVGASIGSLVPVAAAPLELGGGLLVDRSAPVDAMGASPAATQTDLGGYVDVGYAVRRTAHTRLLVGARYEGFATGPVAHAANLRVDAELVGHTRGSFAGTDGCLIASGGGYGNGGVGVFAEAGPTWLADDTRGWTATAGITVRLPAWGAVVIGLPCGTSGGRGAGSSGRSVVPRSMSGG